jgi:hypothetical protein
VTYWTAGLPDVATTSRAAPTAVLGLLRQESATGALWHVGDAVTVL